MSAPASEASVSAAALGLYVHVPFCTVRCAYCDFYLVPGRGRDIAAYVEALCGEIETGTPAFRGRAADTIHFGGGTPSLLPPPLLERLLETLGRGFDLDPGAEIALEANPEDADEERLLAWSRAGFNRVTLGIQSLSDPVLRRMRRPHDARRAMEALAAARTSPFASVGADLILGFPGDDDRAALDGVRRIAGSGVDHVSLYLLELHPRTRLGRDVALGRSPRPDDDAAAGLYEGAAGILVAAGFEHYEISNFARPGKRSRHNQKYWTDAEFLGFGPSAHSYAAGRRWSNAPDLSRYLARGGAGGTRIEDVASPAMRGAEALWTGLRLAEGVDLAALRRRYGPAIPDQADERVGSLRDAGLLEVDGARLRLTQRGRLLSNEVFACLTPDTPSVTPAAR